MNYPTMSWKNKSTDLNNLQGTATFTLPQSPYYGKKNNLVVDLPDFKTAMDIFSFIEEAKRLGEKQGTLAARDAVESTLNNL